MCFFVFFLCFGFSWLKVFGFCLYLSKSGKSREWLVVGKNWWHVVAAPHKKRKRKKKTRRWLPLQKHQPETSRKVRFLVFAKELVRVGFVAERALQTRSRRYTDAFFLISRSRTCRREDFQDEVRAVPRRGTGGRTQTGTFTRVFWTQTNWNG